MIGQDTIFGASMKLRNYLGSEGLNTSRGVCQRVVELFPGIGPQSVVLGGISHSLFRAFYDQGGDGGGAGGVTPPADPAAPAGGVTPPAPDPVTPPEDRTKWTAEMWSTFHQTELNRVQKKVRDEGKEQGRKERDRELQAEKEAADAADKVKQGQFEVLYNDTKSKLDEALAKVKDHDDLVKAFNDLIDDEIKDWVASVKKSDPGKDNLEIRRKWVANNRDVAKELAEARKGPAGEHGGGAGGGGGAGKKPAYTPKYHRPGADKK